MQRALLIAGVILAPGWAQPSHPNSCERLKSLSLPDTTVTATDMVPAGTLAVPGPASASPGSVNMPSYCRVAATIKPTADSHIEMEVWMPVAGWNGKFLGVGNGGWSGNINTLGMSSGLAEGYATASTDRGHKGASAEFAPGHPEKLVDFAYRAVHGMTVSAKTIITAFYGSGPRRSYFTGCSSGGDQGLREAQRYPSDYDGILAGAPGNYWTHLMATGLWVALATLKDKASFVPSGKYGLINRAVLAACDSLGGIKDNILNDPRQCRFDPATLLCPDGRDSPNCLTAPQVEAVRKIYAGPTNPRTGAPIYPGLEPGSELGWGPLAGGPEAFSIHYDHYKYVVHEDPNWDWRNVDLDRDVALADRKDRGAMNAIDPDLGAFQARGGRLILYHGWNDPFLAPRNTINYFDSVRAAMGPAQDDFIRLFMAPGMGHCRGGIGPSQFNALAALERWVESGIAPDQMIAYRVTETEWT